MDERDAARILVQLARGTTQKAVFLRHFEFRKNAGPARMTRRHILRALPELGFDDSEQGCRELNAWIRSTFAQEIGAGMLEQGITHGCSAWKGLVERHSRCTCHSSVALGDQ